jgi:hypothetical protein
MIKQFVLTLCALSAACSASGIHQSPTRTAELTGCSGGVVRSDAELVRYDGCERIDGDLLVVGVSSLAPLASLVQVNGELRIEHTQRLYSLAGLESLRGVRELELRDNAGLISGAAMRSLTQVGHLTIARNPRLSGARSLMHALEQSGAELELEHNAGLAAEGVGDFHPTGSKTTLAQR